MVGDGEMVIVGVGVGYMVVLGVTLTLGVGVGCVIVIVGLGVGVGSGGSNTFSIPLIFTLSPPLMTTKGVPGSLNGIIVATGCGGGLGFSGVGSGGGGFKSTDVLKDVPEPASPNVMSNTFGLRR